MISFRPMNEAEFQAYLDQTILSYAAEKVKAGNWDEATALQRSKDEHQKFLPQGVNSPGNYLNLLVNENGENIGYIWYEVKDTARECLFLFDFEVYEKYRRKGYALQSLNLLEDKAKKLGCKHIDLHVFGFNTGAQLLYSKAGFGITNINMRKSLD